MKIRAMNLTKGVAWGLMNIVVFVAIAENLIR